MQVGLSRKDVLHRSKWIVGINQIGCCESARAPFVGILLDLKNWHLSL